MQLDLIDELQVSLFPYVAGEGTRLFDGVPKSYRLDLVSSTASRSGIVELRVPAAPLTQGKTGPRRVRVTPGQPTSRAGHRRLRAESRRDWARR